MWKGAREAEGPEGHVEALESGADADARARCRVGGGAGCSSEKLQLSALSWKTGLKIGTNAANYCFNSRGTGGGYGLDFDA